MTQKHPATQSICIRCAPEVELGTCYRIVLWPQQAFSEEVLSAWREQKSQLLQQMRDAGIKGSRGLLGQLSQELKDLSFNTIEKPLLTASVPCLSLTRAEALVEELNASASVLAYRINASSLQVLLNLMTGDEIPTLLQKLTQCSPELTWCDEPIVEALEAPAAHEWLSQCRTECPVQEDAHISPKEQEQLATFHHLTVLAKEASDALQASEGRIIIDATLGGGGHSERLLQQGATVWGIDQDPIARAAATKRLQDYGDKFHTIAGNFRDLQSLLQAQGLEEVDGILADIGVSSPQLDCAERGFSFMHDGPLDMRMNPKASLCAADIVNQYSEQDIADILWQYGEERASRAIARRIVQQRQLAPITTTAQLAKIISSVLPRKGKQNPATRSFQGLRIAVNDELGALQALMEQALKLLRPGARLAIITFHSLEDRAVKRFFERVCKAEIDRPEWPEPRPNPDYCAKHVFRKPLIAGEEELSINPRARSAKLRVIEKQ